MFGSTNDIRSKTEDNISCETCYGGFGGRFSYEQCRREGTRGRFMRIVPKVTVYAGILVLFGLIGALCAVLIFHIVEENKALYFPNSVQLEFQSTTPSKLEADVNTSVNSSVSFIGTNLSAENVSAEESRRYRIPIGVMVHEVAESSQPYLAGIRSGDIIVALDGHAVTDVKLIDAIISEYPKGSLVNLTVFRNNTYVSIDLNLE